MENPCKSILTVSGKIQDPQRIVHKLFFETQLNETCGKITARCMR